jgi:hypothetical protein
MKLRIVKCDPCKLSDTQPAGRPAADASQLRDTHDRQIHRGQPTATTAPAPR